MLVAPIESNVHPLDMNPVAQAGFLTTYLEKRYPAPGFSSWNEIAIDFLTDELFTWGPPLDTLEGRYQIPHNVALDVLEDLRQFNFLREQ